MAYMNQQRKAIIAAALKKVIPAGWKYSLAVKHRSTIVLTISEAPVDLLAEVRGMVGDNLPASRGNWGFNPYYLHNQLDASLKLFESIKGAMNVGNHDRSDIQTDYFDVGWYITIQIGKWDKPFVFKPAKALEAA